MQDGFTLHFPQETDYEENKTNVCLFRFGATGQQFKIKHHEVVASTNFKAKSILICITPLYFEACFLFLPFPPLTSFLLSVYSIVLQKQKFFCPTNFDLLITFQN